ncbi:hypothetical protein [Methylomarinum vadi]|uniref:hypothetical protein n=1 Tax=Methylomarinum vadi TaxID=438855 RepID=UPI0012687F22|nr:hypothetical protein [Methylomarinum vadi]
MTDNAGVVRLVDSDQDTGGDVQQYSYDDFTDPNPGGANEGNGWYIDYDPNHPYIKHIVTLSPTQNVGGGEMSQRVVGSYKLYQTKSAAATDLHYRVGTDVDILSYLTRINWGTENTPSIQENQPHRTRLTVDWDLSDKPVPQNSSITITTEFILRNWNAINYSDVHFTYPDGSIQTVFPDISWDFRSPVVAGAAQIANVTGGYVVASFDVIDSRQSANNRLIGSYRLIHQYSFTQSPEKHTFHIQGENGFKISHLRFGHSYSYLNRESLWAFQQWMTDLGSASYSLDGSPTTVNIDWTGRLPYPEGEDIKGRIPDIKKGETRTTPSIYEKDVK